MNRVQLNPMLTERQAAILEFIRAFQSREGIPPSTREIQRHFRFRSQTSAVRHLQALAGAGEIQKLAGRVLGIKAAESGDLLFSVPVYGEIPAGLPAMQDQAPVETITLAPALFGIRRPRAHHLWALNVRGDSMTDAHILDGDIVLLERRDPKFGDIVAALVDETTVTLKRLIKERGRTLLRAANPRFRDIVPTQLECQGVVIGVIRRKLA